MTFKTTQKCCYTGYIVQALAINFLPLLFVMFQKQYNLSYALIGTLISVNFITQLILDVVSVFFLDKVGYRTCAVISQFICTAGFVLLGFLPEIMSPYAGLCIGVILYSIGAGLVEVVINPIVTGLPEDCNPSLVLTHSFYSWGQLLVVLVTTIALKIFGEASWKFISCIWALIPFVNGFFLMKTPIAPPPAEEKREKVTTLFKSKAFIIILLMMICAGGSELAMAQWASTFAQNALGVDKILGDILGPCLFALFMGIGRVIYGLYENKLDFKLYAIINSILCGLCYVAAAVSKNPYISLAGCAVCGFAVSTFWPGTVEVASRKFPEGSGAMYSAIAIFGDIGCSLAPFITGVIASISFFGENSLRAGLIINIFYPVLFIILISSLINKKS